MQTLNWNTHFLTFSSTLQTYWHQRMRKMMMTSSRMMVTRQPIRMAVFLSSGALVVAGLVTERRGWARVVGCWFKRLILSRLVSMHEHVLSPVWVVAVALASSMTVTWVPSRLVWVGRTVSTDRDRRRFKVQFKLWISILSLVIFLIIGSCVAT